MTLLETCSRDSLVSYELDAPAAARAGAERAKNLSRQLVDSQPGVRRKYVRDNWAVLKDLLLSYIVPRGKDHAAAGAYVKRECTVELRRSPALPWRDVGFARSALTVGRAMSAGVESTTKSGRVRSPIKPPRHSIA